MRKEKAGENTATNSLGEGLRNARTIHLPVINSLTARTVFHAVFLWLHMWGSAPVQF